MPVHNCNDPEKQPRADGTSQGRLRRSTWSWSCCLNNKNNNINSRLHICVGKEQSIGKVQERQLGSEGTWLTSPIIQTLSAPHIPLHLSPIHSPHFVPGEQLFLQILTDINPRAADLEAALAAEPRQLVFCLLHLSLSTRASILLTSAPLCSCSRSMRHNSAGLWRLMSELWISFRPFSFQYQALANAANDVRTHAFR